MNMKSIFNDKTLETFKKIRQVFLKVIVGIIIGEIVLLAVLIIAQSANAIIGKFMGTLFVVAIAMFISMCCFKCIEKKQPIAQVLSLVTLGAEVFWFIFQLLELWEVVPMYVISGNNFSLFSVDATLTPFAIFTSIISSIMIYGLFGAWISSIEENGGPIKPLKITALVCDVYIWIVSMISVFGVFNTNNAATVLGLYALAWLALIITWISAASISRRNRREQLDKVIAGGKKVNLDSEEMQAQIREMVEKEVKARMAAEKEKEKK